MNELSNDLNVITAEINSFKQVAGQAVFEIGARLHYVKENDLTHGQWEKWCKDSLNFSARNARRYIGVYDRFSNRTLVSEMGLKKMDMLTAFDDEELETPVSLPSGEVKKPIDMSQAEIEKYKKQLKETESARVRLENESIYYQKLLNQERSKPSQVVTKEVQVIPSDYQDLKQQAAVGQKLNIENIQLQRTIQQMKEDTTRADETAQNCKKLKESFKNLMSAVNQEHYNAKFFYDQIAGTQQTYQIVQAFQQEFTELINTVLLDWKDRTQLKAI